MKKRLISLPFILLIFLSCENIFDMTEYGTVTDELGQEGAAVFQPVLDIYEELPSDSEYQLAYYYARTYKRTEEFENGDLSGTVYYVDESDPARFILDMDRLIDLSLTYEGNEYLVTGLIEIDLSWPDQDVSPQTGTQTITLTVTGGSFSTLRLDMEQTDTSSDTELFLDGIEYKLEDFLPYFL